MKPVIKATIWILLVHIICGAGWCGQSVQAFNKDSKIDWTNRMYVARGRGAMPSAQEEPNRARAYLKAERYAEMAAIANLKMAIEGTTINFESSGRDFMADAEVRQHIEGFVKNVDIGKHWNEQEDGYTIVVAEVRTPMFGDDSPGSAFLDQLQQSESAESSDSPVNVILKPDISPSKSVQPAGAGVTDHANADLLSVKPSSPGAVYTSLVIDTTGYKLDRCMSPKIRRDDGSEVWGTVNVDHDYVQDHGIVVYATSPGDARKNPRCGSNPLIIRAVGRSGGKYYSDPVVSDSDAQLILEENTKSGYLDKFNVIIIKDARL
ncbi:MAG: hypothetical protein ACYC64_17405 [Armatimonadota bacterium]